MAQRPRRASGGQDAVQLGAHALAGHGVELPRTGHEGLLRGGLDGEAQAAGKPHGAQHPQGVLLKAAAGLPHRADDAQPEVPLAAEGVEEAAARMVGHGVDGEVAAGQVLADVGHKADLVRVAAVGVGALHAVGGCLHREPVNHGGHGAVGHTRLVHLNARRAQHALGLLPGRGTGHVHVVAGTAHEGVAHPAAHDPGLVARRLQRVDHAHGIRRHLWHLSVGLRGLYLHALLPCWLLWTRRAKSSTRGMGGRRCYA